MAKTNSVAKNLNQKSIVMATVAIDHAQKNGTMDKLLAKVGMTPRGLKACKQVIRHNGRPYAAKLVMLLATKNNAKKVVSGRARLAAAFARAGFLLGALAFVATSAKVVSYAGAAHKAKTLVSDSSVEATYFASGSNTPDQIRGFSAIGQAIGVAHPELTENGEDALHALAGTDLPVFVDSGAFSEVEFNAPHKCSKKAKACKAGQCIGSGNVPRADLPVGAPFVVAPITEDRWQDILDTYNRLALTLGSQLYVVAPDQVAFQAETLQRLRRWAPEVRSLISLGANVLVAMQKGPAMSQADFHAEVVSILGTDDFVCALPCNKNATSNQEIADFVAKVQPKRLHLLGLGLRNKRTPGAAKAVAKNSPATELSLDSCLICESVGRGNGRASHPAEDHKGPRLFTAAKDAARKMLEAGKSLLALEELAIHLAWGSDQLALC
jgi:hypothetical protein